MNALTPSEQAALLMRIERGAVPQDNLDYTRAMAKLRSSTRAQESTALGKQCLECEQHPCVCDELKDDAYARFLRSVNPRYRTTGYGPERK